MAVRLIVEGETGEPFTGEGTVRTNLDRVHVHLGLDGGRNYGARGVVVREITVRGRAD